MKKLLSWALNEKDVENFWRAQLMKLFPLGDVLNFHLKLPKREMVHWLE